MKVKNERLRLLFQPVPNHCREEAVTEIDSTEKVTGTSCPVLFVVTEISGCSEECWN